MKLTIQRTTLMPALAAVARVVPRATTVPILKCLRLTAGWRGVTIDGTDQQLAIGVRVEATVTAPGAVAVDARLLHDICRQCSDEIELEVRATGAQRLGIQSGGAKFVLQHLAADELPVLETADAIATTQLAGGVLAAVAAQVLIAADTTETRPHLGGVRWEIRENSDTFVATDGHRLALRTWPHMADGTADVTLPARFVAELARAAAAVEHTIHMRLGAATVAATVGGTTLVARLSAGDFPDWRQALPGGAVQTTITADRAALTDAVTRVAILAPEITRGLRIEASGETVRVSVQNAMAGDAEEHVPATIAGDEVTVGINATYLLAALAACDDAENVRIECRGPMAPVEIDRSDVYRHVIMPMRV